MSPEIEMEIVRISTKLSRFLDSSTDKAWKRLKQKLKTITRKTIPMSFDERIAKINEVQRGWLNYFQGTSIACKHRDVDGCYEIACVIAFGTIGRNLNEKGKT